jgi:hypothetical protein
VLKRATEDEVRFKTTYNLGNIAYKLRDFDSAVAFYTQAVTYNPANKDVRHNLELALRELKKQEESGKEPGQHDSDQTDGEQKKGEEGQSQSDKQTPKEGRSEEGSSQKPAEKDSADLAQHNESEQDERAPEQGGEKREEKSPTDLSGDLQPLQAMPEEAENPSGSAMASIDRNKAEALLENIKEDRTKYLRFQIPPEKRGGVPSGKDW